MSPLVFKVCALQFRVKLTVTLPVAVPPGFTSTVYVPVLGRAVGPAEPVAPQMPVEFRVVPSGLRIETFRAIHPV
jgi:hypothetical protein